MNISRIRQMKNRAPFRPFALHLTTGETLAVEHPEQMSLPSDEQELFVVWTSDNWNLLEASQVARIRVRRKQTPTRR